MFIFYMSYNIPLFSLNLFLLIENDTNVCEIMF